MKAMDYTAEETGRLLLKLPTSLLETAFLAYETAPEFAESVAYMSDEEIMLDEHCDMLRAIKLVWWNQKLGNQEAQ